MIQNLRITQDDAKRAVIDGIFPQYSVDVLNIPFTFFFTDKPFPPSRREQLQYIESVVSCRQIPGSEFVKDLPIVFYRELVSTFITTQIRVGECLKDALAEFVKTDESRNYWELFKVTRPEIALKITDSCLNAFQRHWILLNVMADKEDKVKFVGQIFDALKPWLNSDLFARMREHEENARENILFSDGHDMGEVDKKLREKARRIAENVKSSNTPGIQLPDDNLDEISMSGE